MIKSVTFYVVFIVMVFSYAHAQQTRVIAQSDYNYDTTQASKFIITDSTTYQYTGNLGGIGGADFIGFSTSYYYTYNATADTFAYNTLIQQTFDNNNNLTLYTSQNWDATHQAWVNNYQVGSMFDANNNDTLDLYSNWNTLSSQWVLTGQRYNTYSGGHLVRMYNQFYNTATSQFVNQNLDSMTYTPAGLLASSHYYNWDTAHHTWFPVDIHEWLFNANNLDTAFIELIYDTTHQVWDTDFRIHTFFNPDSTPSFSLFFGVTSTDTTEETIYGFDANKNQIFDETLYYNSHAWDSSDEYYIHYNANNQPTFFEHYRYSNGSYQPKNSTYYYYETYSGLPALAEDNNIQLYPNPANSIVHVNATLPGEAPVTLTLYNLLGQPVWNLHLGNAHRLAAMVPVNNLPAGIYMLNVQQGEFSENRRVMVQR